MKSLIYLPLWFFKARFLGIKKPLQTVLFINDQCNLRCKHCVVYQVDNPIIKPYEQIKEELEYSYKTGSRFVDFEGGEPTLWKDGEHDLNSLIRLAKEIGFYSTTITTNAQRPFAGSEADSIWVSLDGLGEYHDKIRGEGTFEKLVQNIETANHPELSVNMVVNSLNYPSVEETIEFAKNNPHIKSISINFHTPYIGTEYLFLDWEIRKQVIDLVIAKKKAGYPIMNSVSGLKLMKHNQFKKECWVTSFIMPDGTRLPECQGKTAGICDQCGLAMSGEMRSVFNLTPGTIWAAIKLRLFLLFLICLGFSCSGEKIKAKQSSGSNVQEVVKPACSFDADSAYIYTQNQVDFGPRVPGTTAHQACGNYLVAELKRFGASVIEQEADLKLYNGKIIRAKNIIGSFQPENKNRILLCAHWDTRPFADQDPDSANHKTPIDGANDGAGSCAVLLEIARQIQIKQPATGIDIIFFDAEDWGAPAFERNNYGESGYCLGSEYWAKNPHVKNYTARFGILLDMVGAPDAVFFKEYFSMRYAANIVQKVWESAAALGYSRYFINAIGGSIEDDHVQIYRHRQIPCIDIIHYDPQSSNGFGAYWHTLNDNMNHISKDTFRAVGETIVYVIYKES